MISIDIKRTEMHNNQLWTDGKAASNHHMVASRHISSVEELETLPVCTNGLHQSRS